MELTSVALANVVLSNVFRTNDVASRGPLGSSQEPLRKYKVLGQNYSRDEKCLLKENPSRVAVCKKKFTLVENIKFRANTNCLNLAPLR